MFQPATYAWIRFTVAVRVDACDALVPVLSAPLTMAEVRRTGVEGRVSRSSRPVCRSTT
jgi:hypothetical protein